MTREYYVRYRENGPNARAERVSYGEWLRFCAEKRDQDERAIDSQTPPSGPYKLFPWIRRVLLRQRP